MYRSGGNTAVRHLSVQEEVQLQVLPSYHPHARSNLLLLFARGSLHARAHPFYPKRYELDKWRPPNTSWLTLLHVSLNTPTINTAPSHRAGVYCCIFVFPSHTRGQERSGMCPNKSRFRSACSPAVSFFSCSVGTSDLLKRSQPPPLSKHRFTMPLVHQNRVVTTVFAFLCLAAPCCFGFLLSPSLTIARLRSPSKVCVLLCGTLECVVRTCTLATSSCWRLLRHRRGDVTRLTSA